jgi:predicted metal-dependent phosphoesterase TrpH
MRIDLHTHSSRSDGTDTPAELVGAARKAGLDVVALTDHDTTAGWDEAFAAAERLGVTVVPGAEISCRWGRLRIHMLAYGFDRAETEFGRERNLLRDDRERRAELIVQRCQELGAPITWKQVRQIAGSAAIGRPHVASALVEAGVVATVDDAFSSDWLADDGRAYVTKYALDPFRALELVHGSGGVAVIAHPAAGSRGLILTDDQIAELARAGLRGVEADHVDHDAAARERIRGLAAELGLVPTGSSDYHGSRKTVRIGEHTTDPAAYEELFEGMPWAAARPAGSGAAGGV